LAAAVSTIIITIIITTATITITMATITKATRSTKGGMCDATRRAKH
jgi:hypothetical protein